MLIVEYQSKSYHRFLNDMSKIGKLKTRFLITFNGATPRDFTAATADLVANTENKIQYSSAITEPATPASVATLFNDARTSRDILLFEKADVLFDKRTAVKNSHERETCFDLNDLFKNIAKHNGMVILAPEKTQTLSASMSTKVDVLIRFPSV